MIKSSYRRAEPSIRVFKFTFTALCDFCLASNRLNKFLGPCFLKEKAENCQFYSFSSTTNSSLVEMLVIIRLAYLSVKLAGMISRPIK